TTAGHHQQLLVMPDDGVQRVVDFIASAQQELRLKQFKLQSPAVLEALRQAHGRGVQLRVMLNPHTSGGDRWNDEAYAALNSCGLDQ
ncbi:MAG: phospholipase D-like domain-containing protein, partial [Synechococcus sp.]